MDPRSENEIAAQQARERKALLAVEGALLLLLLRRTGPIAAEYGALWTPDDLQRNVANDVFAGRRAAATAAQRELRHEADSIGFEVASLALPWGSEVQRAHRAARGMVDGLRRHIALAGLEDVEEAGRDAARWAANRAGLTAATEAATAWQDARDVAIRDAVSREPGLRFELVKVWDAELDKRTCGTCAAAHGTIVRIDEDFPEGVPGHVHPRCRCVYHVMTVREWRAIS